MRSIASAADGPGGSGSRRRARLLVLVAIVVLVLLIEFDLVQVAYERLGLSPRAAWLVLVASWFGSGINLPIARLPLSGGRGPERELRLAGVVYRLPGARRSDHSVVAVNLGGAVIPTGMASYLLLTQPIGFSAGLATLGVAAGVHAVARPVRGLGIVTPFLVPPLLAAAAALLVPSPRPAAVAFVAGTLGTLLGADLLNLGRIHALGSPFVAIGGGGTVDGIFLAGIVAVLMA